MTADRWDTARPTRAAAVLALLVFTVGVAPIALVPAQSPVYVGIATATPTVYTYTIAVALALVGAVWFAPDRIGRPLWLWAPAALWLLVLTVTVWGPSARVGSGLLQLGLGALAFVIGAASTSRTTVLGWAFAAVAWVQLAAIALAGLGHPLRTITGARSLDIDGRAIGLTTHPGDLSKLLFFCAVCVLALPQRSRWQRWLVWSTLGAVFAGVSLTESRTVLVAVVVLVVGYVGLESTAGRWDRRHLAIVGLTLGLGAASVPWLVARFTADPFGGARTHLTEVGLRAIGEHPWTGVGANSYVAVVGATDQLTGYGVPVHNVFLLTAAELGIPGALLLWLPVGVVAVRAVAAAARTRGADPAAALVVSALPGLVLIGLTGWGLLQGPYLLVLLLVLGYFGARIGARPAVPAERRAPSVAPASASVSASLRDLPPGERSQRASLADLPAGRGGGAGVGPATGVGGDGGG